MTESPNPNEHFLINPASSPDVPDTPCRTRRRRRRQARHGRGWCGATTSPVPEGLRRSPQASLKRPGIDHRRRVEPHHGKVAAAGDETPRPSQGHRGSRSCSPGPSHPRRWASDRTGGGRQGLSPEGSARNAGSDKRRFGNGKRCPGSGTRQHAVMTQGPPLSLDHPRQEPPPEEQGQSRPGHADAQMDHAAACCCLC
jgi:hypothetical protein